jgi:hypothetical protein
VTDPDVLAQLEIELMADRIRDAEILAFRVQSEPAVPVLVCVPASAP